MDYPHVHSTNLQLYVKVGSRNEDQKINGISHLIEHMNFKGTAQRTAQQILIEIEDVGASINAGTSDELTSYSVKILEQYMPLAIDVIFDMVFNSTYSENALEKEKLVVIQEIHQYEDDPTSVVQDNFIAQAFPNQSLGRTILGTEENVNNINRNDILEYNNRFYQPSNMILAATGKVNHQELVNLIASKNLTNTNQSCESDKEKAKYVGGYITNYNPELSQAHIIIGYEGVNITSPNLYKYSMLSSILGSGMSSRLFKEVREEKSLVYSIDSDLETFEDTGIFTISFSTTPDKVNEVFQTISKIIKEIPYTINQQELDRFIAKLKSAIYMKDEDHDRKVSNMAEHYINFGRVISSDEILEKYSMITIDDLSHTALEVFSTNLTVSILGSSEDFPTYEDLSSMLTL